MRVKGGAPKSLVFVADLETDSAVGQPFDVGDPHRQPAAELGPARWRGERRERPVRLTRERHLVLEQPRAGWAFDPVRLFEDRPVADDAPDEQSARGQALVKSLLGPVLEQEVLAPV